MDEPRAYEIMKQIVTGMNELVKLKIVHRDLKPANILHHNGIFKIADFGLAKHIDNEDELLLSAIGTYGYMAPQILQKMSYTSKCDIWSLGMVFYFVLFGVLPWDTSKKDQIFSNIMCKPLRFPRDISNQTHKLLSGMLKIN